MEYTRLLGTTSLNQQCDSTTLIEDTIRGIFSVSIRTIFFFFFFFWLKIKLNFKLIPNSNRNKVLQISPGIEYPGSMRWELFACLICAWLMVYFATWKSIKSSAKV